jgi:hypothetical protein
VLPPSTFVSDSCFRHRWRLLEIHIVHQTDDELAAGIALMQALQSQGKNPQAREEADQHAPTRREKRNRLVHLQFAVASASIEPALGHTESARRQLEQALKDARNRQFLRVELEARLALAQLNRQSGGATVAKAQLASPQARLHARSPKGRFNNSLSRRSNTQRLQLRQKFPSKPNFLKENWCPREDSNLHSLARTTT